MSSVLKQKLNLAGRPAGLYTGYLEADGNTGSLGPGGLGLATGLAPIKYDLAGNLKAADGTSDYLIVAAIGGTLGHVATFGLTISLNGVPVGTIRFDAIETSVGIVDIDVLSTIGKPQPATPEQLSSFSSLIGQASALIPQMQKSLTDTAQTCQTVITTADAAAASGRTAVTRAIDGITAANANPANPALLASRVRVGQVAELARGSGGLQIGYNLPFWADKPDRDAPLVRLLGSGARFTRAGISWATSEPSDGVYNWASLDWLLQTSDSYGLHLLLLISEHAPTWAKAAGHEYPADPAKLGRFVGLIAQRAAGYANYRVTIEGWNEGDLPDVGWPAAQFATAMLACHDAAKGYGVEVITGALYRPDPAYLQAMYNAQPRLNELAGVGVHIYVQDGAGPEFIGNPDALSTYDKLSWVRATMDANGHKSGSIWLTETGWCSPGSPFFGQQVSEAQGALYAERAVNYLRSHPDLRVAAMLWYQLALDDAAPGTGAIEQHYGTHRSDGTPKAHFRVLQSLITPGVQGNAPRRPLGINDVLARADAYIPNNEAQWFPSTASHNRATDNFTERLGRRVLQRDTMTADSVYDGLNTLGYTASDFAMAGWSYPQASSDSGVGFEFFRMIVSGYGASYSLFWNGVVRVGRQVGGVSADENATFGGKIKFGAGSPVFWAISVSSGWATVWIWTAQNKLMRYELHTQLFPGYSVSNPALQILVQSPGQVHSGPLGLWPSLNDADIDAMLSDWWPVPTPLGGQRWVATGSALPLPTGESYPELAGPGFAAVTTPQTIPLSTWTAQTNGLYLIEWGFRVIDNDVPAGSNIGHGIENNDDPQWHWESARANRMTFSGS